MFTLTFWKDLVERTARTFVQAAGAAVTVQWVDAGSLDGVDWSTTAEVGVYAGIGAVLFSLFARYVGSKNTASFGIPKDQ